MLFLADTYTFTNKQTQKSFVGEMQKNLERMNIKNYRWYTSSLFFEKKPKKKWSLLFLYELTNEKEVNQIPMDTHHLIRREQMILTPNSYIQNNNWISGKTVNIVEHVQVYEGHLEEFRDIMVTNNTPAMQYIIQNKNWCKEFIALETTNILFHHDHFPKWNQIHLISMKLTGIIHYKKDFNEGLSLHSDTQFTNNFARLKQIREFTYKSSGKLHKC